jgi:hypothetical protein
VSCDPSGHKKARNEGYEHKCHNEGRSTCSRRKNPGQRKPCATHREHGCSVPPGRCCYSTVATIQEDPPRARGRHKGCSESDEPKPHQRHEREDEGHEAILGPSIRLNRSLGGRQHARRGSVSVSWANASRRARPSRDPFQGGSGCSHLNAPSYRPAKTRHESSRL